MSLLVGRGPGTQPLERGQETLEALLFKVKILSVVSFAVFILEELLQLYQYKMIFMIFIFFFLNLLLYL